MTLEKQIEILKEWHKRAGTEMYLPIMSSEDIERFLRWLEDYKVLKDEMIPAYDEQLTEAQCKVVQQMREMKQLKSDYADLDNRLRTANTEIDRLKSVSSWIQCSERMPEYDHYVLVWHKPNDMIYTAVLDCDNNGWELDDNLGEYRYASFENAPCWMPLPEPPQRKDDTHDYD